VLVLAAALFSFGEVSADQNFFFPGNLVISRSVYDNNPGNVQVGMTLPPIVRSLEVARRLRTTEPIRRSSTMPWPMRALGLPPRYSWIKSRQMAR